MVSSLCIFHCNKKEGKGYWRAATKRIIDPKQQNLAKKVIPMMISHDMISSLPYKQTVYSTNEFEQIGKAENNVKQTHREENNINRSIRTN